MNSIDDIITVFENKPWDMYLLSGNDAITLDIIKKHENIK